MKLVLLLAALCVLCSGPANFTVHAAELDRVLAQIQAGAPSSLDAAENELVAAGPTSLPLLRQALAQRRAALAKPGDRPLPEVRRLEAEVNVLDGAETSLNWGVQPRALISQFVAKLPASMVQEWVRSARPKRIADPALAEVFPKHLFYILYFSPYPVGRPLPEPLRGQNLFALSRAGTLEHVTDATAMERLLRPLLPAAHDDAARKRILHAWLRLTQEFSQDTMFEFSIPVESLQVIADGTGWQASGKAVVKPVAGNQGEISVTLRFDGAGQLLTATEARTVRAGIRPRCQATKLLDADPIVRAMAEQDILVMGRAGAAYLGERHQLAAPELKVEIERLWQQILVEGR